MDPNLPLLLPVTYGCVMLVNCLPLDEIRRQSLGDPDAQRTSSGSADVSTEGRLLMDARVCCVCIRGATRLGSVVISYIVRRDLGVSCQRTLCDETRQCCVCVPYATRPIVDPSLPDSRYWRLLSSSSSRQMTGLARVSWALVFPCALGSYSFFV